MSEFDDPEMSYRRGFYHGARALFEEIQACLPPDRRTVVQHWIQKDVFGWRLQNLRGKSGRRPFGEITAEIAPPDISN